MKSRWVVMLAGAGMAIAIVVLGLKVWRLEQAVASLSQQVQQPPRIVYPASAVPGAPAPTGKPNVFRLLKSAHAEGESTAVGVPWGVEKAMMLDGKVVAPR